MKREFFSRKILWNETTILIYLALAKLAIHLLTANNYGYFGDELYFLSMTKHLDFGYVDVPPFIVYVAALSRWLIGDSLFAIHVLPAIAGAIMVFLAGLLVRELGGGRFAQWFTALIVLMAPFWLVENSIFTYEPFDQLFVLLVFYMIVLLIKQETPKRWLIFGLIAGIGIMIKLSMIFTGFGLAVALVLTSRRKSFLTWWPWLAGLIAIAICTPYIAWQWNHDWPLLKYWHNYAMYRQHNDLFQFFQNQNLALNPVTLPIWLIGLYYLLFHREGKKFRILGLIHLVMLIVFSGFMKMESRIITSSYFPLLAAGAVFLERIIMAAGTRRLSFNWLKPVYTGILLVSGVFLAPSWLPVLPVPVLERYLGIITNTPVAINLPMELPFAFSFRFGWPEMAKQIADIYHGLPEDERQKCVIYTGNYAEAGAIDLYGKAYGLPSPISNHLSYQIWGPGQNTGEVAIVFGRSFSYLDPGFTSIWLSGIYHEVNHVAIISHKYSTRLERNLAVFVCRKPKMSLHKVWEMFEDFH
jgi:hypothetical protein